jgi:hypothetical protein
MPVLPKLRNFSTRNCVVLCTMRILLAALALCTLTQPITVRAEVAGSCGHAFEANFQAGGQLNMRLRSGDIEVKGVDAPVVRVSCELKHDDEAQDVTITFKASGHSGDLRIQGGPRNDIRFRIEVPRSSHLFVRSPAGDLTVKGVAGDKDVEIHAGDLTIEVGNPADYSHADASVYAGDLTASAFGVTKDGLFRSFNKDNPAGKYRLHAHVAAGDLVLK